MTDCVRRKVALRLLLTLVSLLPLSACGAPAQAGARAREPGVHADRSPAAAAWPETLRGHLLLIGGALDNENRAVYERFIELARTCAAKQGALNASAATSGPLVLIATAASANEDAAAESKRSVISRYCPECAIEVIGRTSAPGRAEALIGRAHAMFFTGGDQKRITTRYLRLPTPSSEGAPGEESRHERERMIDTEEAAAMRALLARGGVIAGTSAGEAMMSDPMFLGGGSAEALGVRSSGATASAEDEDAPASAAPAPGPRLGQGMGFAPHLLADSHFFERDRFGRLVAALEVSGRRVGVGVGEDACVELDLSTGVMTGLSAAGSLLVDAGGLVREGPHRRGVRANVIAQGERVDLRELLGSRAAPAPRFTETCERLEAGATRPERRTASWRFFTRATAADAPALRLTLDGYEQVAWPAGGGWAALEIRPAAPAEEEQRLAPAKARAPGER
ncbi:MAG: cyanophycinase [Phycisphaerales bacterium]